jgi:Sulfotransferase family
MKRPLVYIHAASHSGSTLLARELARHPEVATVGELSGTLYRARPGYQCSCGRELEQCAFWRRVAAAMARRGISYSPTTAETDIRNASNPIARWLLKPMHRGRLLEAARDLGLALVCRSHVERHQRMKTALVESIAECTGKRVLVDSSKSGVQLKYHLRNPGLDVKVIWLVRDGRGVALSIVRNQGAPLAQGAYEWRRRNEEAQTIVRCLERSRWIQVRYEALCADPERTLDALWRFIGVAPGRHPGAARELHVLGHRTRLDGAAPIKPNEKWRTELSAEDLMLFEAVAGPVSRQLGYA